MARVGRPIREAERLSHVVLKRSRWAAPAQVTGVCGDEERAWGEREHILYSVLHVRSIRLFIHK